MRAMLGVVLVLALCAPALAADYVPPKGDAWATHTPAREGFDAGRLKAAADFAIDHEATVAPELARVIDPRDLRITIPLQFAGEPFSPRPSVP